MQYGFDAWGRPIAPQPQQYNPYTQQYQPQPPQQTVSKREYDELLDTVSKLGERMYGEYRQGATNQGSGTINPAANSQTNTPHTAQITLIPVASEADAWKYPNDLINGTKQYFIDDTTMTIYAKWVDDNIDLVKAVGKLQIIKDDGTGEVVVSKTENTIDVVETLKGVDDKLNELSNDLIEVKALIGAANVFQTTKSKVKKVKSDIEVIDDEL